MKKVPFIDLKRCYQVYKEELEKKVLEVLRSGIYLNGPQTKELENLLANYLGTSCAIGVSSGTEALYLILKALDLPQNTYVLVPSFTFVATAEVVMRAGLVPFFVDVEEDTYNISLESLKESYERLTKQRKKVSAVIAVSLFGLPAHLKEIQKFCKEKDIYLIEDICQAFGAKIANKKVGTFGIASATSFYPTKPLSTFGDAGMVFTSNKKIARTIRYLKEHGQIKPYFYKYHGVNGRIDEIHSAILLVKFKHFEKEIALRKTIVGKYIEGLKNLNPHLKLPYFPKDYFSSYSLFTIRAKNRNKLKKFLESRGIGTGIYYSKPLHLQPVYKNLNFRNVKLPITERLAKEVLSLPLHPYLTEEEINYVISSIRDFYKSK
ncbi:MAG: DegT/DnrJ/EryC1/StrS family aminotransferase [Thermodesulfobacterium sp.]|uniref:dTDP-4-amino-4 n=1 Tax=Candidatus Thermodesulfobacterium syntrophicum TaxID=3060442 RepID=A0AAE3P459_9BACT|nr:DegT/DnrJ/EryC1/StrS family aminotransferase [Thermodesulfobacterium sp.]MDF2953330.1 dTDP-4-amino-4 [Candidatus Thermodesulfobacterium syntrophicum]